MEKGRERGEGRTREKGSREVEKQKREKGKDRKKREIEDGWGEGGER